MADLSLASSAFAGFQLMARRPLALLAWWLILVAGVVALEALALAAIFATSQLPGMFGFVIHASLFLPAVAWLAGTVLVSAVYRMLLRPGETGMAGLRLGPDELRLAPVVLMAVILITALTLPVVLSGIARLAAMLVLLLLSPWFSLIGPALFARRRFSSEGWTLAKGRYWDLLAMNFLAWSACATLFVLLGPVGKRLMVMNFDQVNRMVHKPLMEGAILLATLVMPFLLFGVALLVILTAPAAEAYRRLTSPPAPGP